MASRPCTRRSACRRPSSPGTCPGASATAGRSAAPSSPRIPASPTSPTWGRVSDPRATRSLDMGVRDELPVTCLRLPSVLAECSEHDVDGEEGGRSNETGGRAEAAPAPLLRSVAEVCPDRIQDDVAAVLEELGVAFDQVRSIPALKDVAGTLVALVEPLRVRVAEVAHACAPGGLRRLDEQVEMVRHRAVRVTVPGEPLDGTRKHPQPGLVIAVVTEQRPLQVPAREDVKEAPGDLRSEASGH